MARRNITGALDAVLDTRSKGIRSTETPRMHAEGVREFNTRRKAAARAALGGRQVSCDLGIDGAAALVYVKQQWGFPSTREAVRVALRLLAKQTREGLQRIDLEDTLRGG
jgi:hypothetical protein